MFRRAIRPVCRFGSRAYSEEPGSDIHAYLSRIDALVSRPRRAPRRSGAPGQEGAKPKRRPFIQNNRSDGEKRPINSASQAGKSDATRSQRPNRPQQGQSQRPRSQHTSDSNKSYKASQMKPRKPRQANPAAATTNPESNVVESEPVTLSMLQVEGDETAPKSGRRQRSPTASRKTPRFGRGPRPVGVAAKRRPTKPKRQSNGDATGRRAGSSDAGLAPEDTSFLRPSEALQFALKYEGTAPTDGLIRPASVSPLALVPWMPSAAVTWNTRMLGVAQTGRSSSRWIESSVAGKFPVHPTDGGVAMLELARNASLTPAARGLLFRVAQGKMSPSQIIERARP